MLSGCGSLAQWLERRSHKPLVAGSNPAGSTIFYALIINDLSLGVLCSPFPFFSHHSALFLRGKMAQSSSNRQASVEQGAE